METRSKKRNQLNICCKNNYYDDREDDDEEDEDEDEDYEYESPDEDDEDEDEDEDDIDEEDEDEDEDEDLDEYEVYLYPKKLKELGLDEKEILNFENLDEEDIKALAEFKKNSPECFERFIKCKDIIKNREISIIDILKANMNDERRANLIEQFECLRQIPECTEEYLFLRNKIKKLYVKYMSEDKGDLCKIKQDDDSVYFRNKLNEVKCSESILKVLEEKLDEYDDLEKGEEKLKLKKWINSVLSLPLDKIHENEIQDITLKIKETSEHFNNKLYGMNNVKERLILFLNKKLREKNSKGCNIALVGKPGVGKCLHGDTLILMYNLKFKKARDVRVGDNLMGDDCKPRKVLSITSGVERMYKIIQEAGKDYIVNRSHILTLTNSETKKIEDICLENFLLEEKDDGISTIKINKYYPTSIKYSGNLSCTHQAFMHGINLLNSDYQSVIPDECVKWNYVSKEYFYKGLISNKTYISYEDKFMNIKVGKDKPIEKVVFLLRSMGYRCIYDEFFENIKILVPKPKENLNIKYMGEGTYYGFTLDGNERFVLEDWTVTHNTAIAKSLSESLNLPFAQISFGGITSPEFLMGHDYTYVGSRLGEISRCLNRMGSKNGILFFDEFDKASDKKEIMSSLLHITDFSQNNEFRDNYCPEITQDLSKIWFIYSMNELPSDPAMLDRLEIIKVDEYGTNERELICKNYLFPKYLNELKIKEKVVVEESCIKKLVLLSSSGMDKKGVRELERYIGIVVEKVYFYICNLNSNFNYDWFNKISKYYKDEKVYLNQDLAEKLTENSKYQETSFMSMYM